jgi:AAA ATPase domain
MSRPVHVPFIEAPGREHALRALCDAYDDVRRAESPAARVVAITGRPGVGKTRVAQRFYETLAAAQNYWPPSLIDEHGPILSQQRKRVAPLGAHAVGGGDMPFLWLGVDCEREGDVLSDDVANLRAVLREHLPSVFQPRSSGKELGEAAADEVVATATGTVLEEAAKLAVPGIGFAIAGVKFVWRKRRQSGSRERAREVEQSARSIDPSLT